MFWVAEDVVWILITYSESLNRLSLQRHGLVGGLQSQIPAKTDKSHRARLFILFRLCLLLFSFLCGVISSLLNCSLTLFFFFLELFFIHLDICAIKSLSSLELVREGCLLNDLRAPRGVDLNLFGRGMGL